MCLWNRGKIDTIDCVSRTDTRDDVIYLFTIELMTRLQTLTTRDFKTEYICKSKSTIG